MKRVQSVFSLVSMFVLSSSRYTMKSLSEQVILGYLNIFCINIRGYVVKNKELLRDENKKNWTS